MALISCAECNKDISDKARICPSCGSPLGHAQVTIEKTSKAIKKNILVSVVMIFMGFLFYFSVNDHIVAPWGLFVGVVGIIFLIMTYGKRWWNHG